MAGFVRQMFVIVIAYVFYLLRNKFALKLVELNFIIIIFWY